MKRRDFSDIFGNDEEQKRATRLLQVFHDCLVSDLCTVDLCGGERDCLDPDCIGFNVEDRQCGDGANFPRMGELDRRFCGGYLTRAHRKGQNSRKFDINLGDFNTIPHV